MSATDHPVIPETHRFSIRWPRSVAIGLVALVPIAVFLTWFSIQERQQSKSVHRIEVQDLPPTQIQYLGTTFRPDENDSTSDNSDVRVSSTTALDEVSPAFRNPDASRAIEGRILNGLFTRIRKTVPRVREFDVEVTFTDGIAVLRGTVSSDVVRQQLVEAARDAAAEIEDVHEVCDLLVTKQAGVGEKGRR